jgi:hypothetical protein
MLSLLLISSHLFNVESRCMTDANGNAVGNCTLPPGVSSNATTANKPPQHVDVPVVLYLLAIISAACGGTSLCILKKMR